MFGHHPAVASARTNIACGSCRFRKVKCSGAHPCTQCAHLGLRCTFSPPSAKRKHGARGNLVRQLKERAASKCQAVQPSYTGSVTTSPLQSAMAPVQATNLTNCPRNAADYSAEFFLALVPDYQQVVYPMNPIITPDEIRAAVAAMDGDAENAALVYAFAAITIIFIQTSRAACGEMTALMTDLIQRSLTEHRKSETRLSLALELPPTLGEIPVTVKRIMTCIFLEMSMISCRLFDRCFVMLREAISLTQSLPLFRYGHDEYTSSMGRHEVARRQRLYWECFLHERFFYIVSGRPAVLPSLPTGPPLEDPSIPPHVDAGFGRLIGLFRVMDDTFLRHWNADQQQDPERITAEKMTAEWVEQKQAELDLEECATAAVEERLRAAGGPGLSELQHADIFITRLWLRTLVWQLALSRGLLRSAPPRHAHHGLSLHFPADRLSSQLRRLVCHLESAASIATHGSGILQKLFEITTTIADVLALPPGQMHTQDDIKQRIEDFVFLVNFLFRFEKVRKEERDYIREKLETLQQLYAVAGCDVRALFDLGES